MGDNTAKSKWKQKTPNREKEDNEEANEGELEGIFSSDDKTGPMPQRQRIVREECSNCWVAKQKENPGIRKRKTAQKKEIYADKESTDEEERRERRMKGWEGTEILDESAIDVKRNGSDTKSNPEDGRWIKQESIKNQPLRTGSMSPEENDETDTKDT